jgi:hypothetical protein
MKGVRENTCTVTKSAYFSGDSLYRDWEIELMRRIDVL